MFVLNNSGYLIERLLCKDPKKAYNDLAQWRYSELPHALGCDDWLTARVSTCEELDKALKAADQATSGAYIEVLTDAYAASGFPISFTSTLKRFINNSIYLVTVRIVSLINNHLAYQTNQSSP